MANRRRKKQVRLEATLDDCERAIDFLEEAENYDSEDEYRVNSLKVRIRDYPEGSGIFFLFLTWYGTEKPGAEAFRFRQVGVLKENGFLRKPTASMVICRCGRLVWNLKGS